MEATPSLACANKCVFCWRHHTNPVGKSWQWKMDDPVEIVNSAIELHKNMIKQMKGVPGKVSFHGSVLFGDHVLIQSIEHFECEWVK
jgi:wyosine [tRNA(Phe)-imidazoG37] synthetase (radical SAM superfamily)